LLALVLVSVVMMVLEVTTRLLQPLRETVATILTPVHFVAELPYLAGGGLGEVMATREALLAQVREQDRQLLELRHIAQQYQSLATENDRLRALLGSRARLPSEVLIAELIGVVPTPGTHQIILDKGSVHGLRSGMPVIDAYGLFGQIIEVTRFTSRVLLITDINHAVPVRVNRNGVRSIAGGTGDPVYLELENVPITADIVEGDLVETSGLGGGFPRGYPVGTVERVRIEPTSAFAQVRLRPHAQLDRSRYLLVVLDVPDEAPAEVAEADPETDPGEAAAATAEPATEGQP